MCIDSSIKKSKRTNVFIEEMIELIVDEKKILTFICSPQGLKELAIGFLYSKGIINSIEDIEKIKILSKEKKNQVVFKDRIKRSKKEKPRISYKWND
ncbi:MAG: formate dehydrogenase accessory sulfurtransferase FdhD [Psychrilyobacter sp.]|nr:formate dehydrogenase accessory sulfurtransferase FdhD [Psychrilyobacter sp.]